MTESGETIAIFEAEDGILLFGSETALAAVDAGAGGMSRPISSKHLARVGGHGGAAAGKLMAESGRWVKLTRESAKARQASGDLLSGAIRGDKGQILKHLKFENLSKGGLLTPAAPAVLGSMATQYALESALDEITAYLETIDRKLDQLLEQRKTETLGQIGGVALAIDEATAIYAETGAVSTVTWSKVQGTSLALQTMQAEAIAQLNGSVEDVSAAAGDVDKAAKALEQAREDVQFWLGVLARTIALQDRQYVLELARVEDEDPLQLDAHRQGITVARADRVRRIVAALESVSMAVSTAAAVSNAAKVANPIAAPKVARQANAISDAISTFAAHADLEMRELGNVSMIPWRRAARALVGEASSAVGTAGASVADRAKAASQAVEQRRDEKVMRRAKKIEEKRLRRE